MQAYGIPILHLEGNLTNYEVSYYDKIGQAILSDSRVFEKITLIEMAIASDENLTSEQKEKLFYFASFLKWNYEGLVSSGISFQDRQNAGPYPSFDDCMKAELLETFADDGNPFPEAEFITGLPWSFWWQVGECLWLS